MKRVTLLFLLLIAGWLMLAAVNMPTTPNQDAPNALRGHAGACVMHADGSGAYHASHYSCIPYHSGMCLLPTADNGYLEPSAPFSPVYCVNTGKIATPEQIAANIFADQCVDGGYVACAVPCFDAHGVPVPCADTWNGVGNYE